MIACTAFGLISTMHLGVGVAFKRGLECRV